MAEDVGSILRDCRFFSAVSPDRMARLASMGRLKSYDKDEVIFRQGDPCSGVFVVGTGLVRIYRAEPSGKEHVLHLVSPGGTFAEVAAIGGFDCPANAQALEATTCAYLPTADFNRALRDDHGLAIQLLMSMAGWVKHMVGLVEDISLRDAAGRVARYLIETADAQGQVVLPSLKRHLASHLNLTSETLSRTLRRLSEAELITVDGESIRLHARPQLEEVAQGMGPLV
ncbi:MAG: Crp/Fnr family transcriptional regulator [Phycisphaeraceae bacterium]|nr:Crp/Fnr family transcriptional regulator [Phycisphaeraceae bacterium]